MHFYCRRVGTQLGGSRSDPTAGFWADGALEERPHALVHPPRTRLDECTLFGTGAFKVTHFAVLG